jgi:hypothetical protein
MGRATAVARPVMASMRAGKRTAGARGGPRKRRTTVTSAYPANATTKSASAASSAQTDSYPASWGSAWGFYWLLPEGRGRGLATHAVRLLVNWGFDESGVHRVALYTKEGNIASERVAERCGFRYTGTVERHKAMRCSGFEGGSSTRGIARPSHTSPIELSPDLLTVFSQNSPAALESGGFGDPIGFDGSPRRSSGDGSWLRPLHSRHSSDFH